VTVHPARNLAALIIIVAREPRAQSHPSAQALRFLRSYTVSTKHGIMTLISMS
jgi:hypothetical protein